MNTPRLSQKLFAALVAAAGASLLPLATSVQATPYNWIGATSTTWDAGWTGAAVPTSADDLTILGPGNAAGALIINVAADAFASTITVTDTSAVTLSNTTSGADKTLTLQGGLTTGTGAVTIGSATANQGVLIALGASQTWNIGSGGLTATNIISGTGFSLTKTGAGLLTLSAANTYTGGTTISTGTVKASNTGALGAGTTTLSAGTTLQQNVAAALTSTIGGTGTVEFTANANTTIGALTGSGTLALVNKAGVGSSVVDFGSGTLTNFTGKLTLSRNNTANGGFRLNSTTAYAGTANTWFDLTDNVTLQRRDAGSANDTINLGSLSGTAGTVINTSGSSNRATTWVIGARGDNTTFAGVVSNGGTGAGAVKKVGTGSLTLSGANTYTGTTTVSAGTLIAGADSLVSTNGAFGNAATSITLGDTATTTNNSSASLLTGGAFTIGRSVTIANQTTSGTYTIGGNTDSNSTFSGAIAANQSFTVSQVATTGANALSITGGISSANAGSKTVTFNNAGAVNVGTTAISNGSGTVSVAQTGAGTTTLSVANSYTGATIINAGTLALGVGNALATGTAITLGGGTLNLGGFSPAAFTNALTLTTGSSTIDFGSHIGGITLTFGDSQAASWTGGSLALLNFTVGTDNLNFTSIAGGLTSTQLSQINLSGYTATGFDGGGNVTFTISSVPEPSTYAALAGLACLGFVALRRRRA